MWPISFSQPYWILGPNRATVLCQFLLCCKKNSDLCSTFHIDRKVTSTDNTLDLLIVLIQDHLAFLSNPITTLINLTHINYVEHPPLHTYLALLSYMVLRFYTGTAITLVIVMNMLSVSVHFCVLNILLVLVCCS